MSRPLADEMNFIGLKNALGLLLEVGGGAADTLTGIRWSDERSPPFVFYLQQKEEACGQKQRGKNKKAWYSLPLHQMSNS